MAGYSNPSSQKQTNKISSNQTLNQERFNTTNTTVNMKPYLERHFKQSNFVKALEHRENGFCSTTVKSIAKEPLIKLLIRTRWCFSQSCTLRKDYKVLISSGDLDLWEYTFANLLSQQMKRAAQECRPSDEKPGQQLMEQLKKPEAMRFSLPEFIKLILKQGFELCVTDEDDICMIVESYSDAETRLELLRIVIAYSIEKRDHFIFTTTFQMLLRFILGWSRMEWFERDLQLLDWMFNSGLSVPYEYCREWVSSAFQDFYGYQDYETRFKMLKYMREKGIDISGAFQNFCRYKIIMYSLLSPEDLEMYLSFARYFVANQAVLPQTRTKEQFSVSETLKSTLNKSRSSAMTAFVESCIENELHLVIEDDNDGLNMLLIMCRSHNGRDLPDIVNLLCKAKLNINSHDYLGNNALMLLAEREDSTSQEVRESVNVLLDHGIDVNQNNMDDYSPLQRFVHMKKQYCCNFKLLHHWSECKYWDVLNALVNSGCRVEPLVFNGSSLLFDILQRAIVTKVCDNCSPSADELSKSQVFIPAFHFIERLLQCGSSLLAIINVKQKVCERLNVLFYIVANYKGNDLLTLVELFCKYGANVNDTTRLKINSYGAYCYPMDLIKIFKRENPTENHLTNRLTEILQCYGFHH